MYHTMGSVALCMTLVTMVITPATSSPATCAAASVTKAVKWTFYKRLNLQWNAASKFCHQKGGHLPVLNTDVTMKAFQDVVQKWTNQGVDDLWLGLHSPESGRTPDVWEADCSQQWSGVQYWDTANGEPNDLDSDFCVRLSVSSKLWKTKDCRHLHSVVCETNRAECTYKSFHDMTMTSDPDASASSIADVSQCWERCLQLRVEGKECVAAALETGGLCRMVVGSQLTELSSLSTTQQPGAVLMLKRCFTSTTDQKYYSFSYFGNGLTPSPAAHGSCPAGQGIAPPRPPDCLPPGVALGLVDVSTKSSSSSSSPTSQQTSAISSSTPQGKSTSMLTAGTTPTTDVTTPTRDALSTPTRDALTTPTRDAPTTPTRDVTTRISGDVTTSTMRKGGHQRACRCLRNNRSSKQHDIINDNEPAFIRIHINTTSRYRRSKTSAAHMQTSHNILGGAWMVVFIACCGFIALPDVCRLTVWLWKRRRWCYSCGRPRIVPEIVKQSGRC